MFSNQEKNPYRKLVVGVNQKVPLAHGGSRRAINFDNAATTPPFRSALKAIQDFAPWYSSIHRGKGYKSVTSSQMYERARDTVISFVGANRQRDTVIFVKNSTEAINLLARSFSNESKKPVILTTQMEHLSNDLPWRAGFERAYVQVDAQGRLSLTDLCDTLEKYAGRVSLVTVTGASNVTGIINPIHEIAELTHKHHAYLHVDAAQLVPHAMFDMYSPDSNQHIDFVSFTGHKLYAPFGAGVLVGNKEHFRHARPLLVGGGSASLVSGTFVQWDGVPTRFEAGTPNIMGVISLAAAIRTFRQIGIPLLAKREQNLLEYLYEELTRIPEITLFGPNPIDTPRVGIACFSLEGLHQHDVAQALSDDYGIAVRSGFFCAHPYVQTLLGISEEEMEVFREDPISPFPGLVRISIGLYNTLAEVRILVHALQSIAKKRNQYAERYLYNPKGSCGVFES
jgi:selenocysteine lyase/cysteine desulfurase